MKRKIYVERHPRMDSGNSIFFTRELEQISAENFDVVYTQNKVFQFVPMDTSVDPLAEEWTYRSYDDMGEAALIKSYSKAGFPRVGQKGVETTVRLKDYGDSFGYTIPEIQRAQKYNRPLDRDLARVARNVVNKKLEDVICDGNSVVNQIGFLNVSGTNTYTVPAGAATLYTLRSKTADECITDLEGMINKAADSTKDIENSNTILLPSIDYRYLKNKPRSSTSDTSVLEYFLSTNPGVSVFPWERLETASSSGYPLAVAYEKNPLKVRCLLPIAFEQMDPQLDGMEYTILCRARTGGVIAPFPKSITYATFHA